MASGGPLMTMTQARLALFMATAFHSHMLIASSLPTLQALLALLAGKGFKGLLSM